jgi:AcrR family transcriptional regulator
MGTVNRGRPRAEPDPEVRAAILSAAVAIVHEDGLNALGVLQVLTRAQLSTRAFYRHFESKEKLIMAVFVEIARAEMHRLQQGMGDEDPVRAVVAWIERRLDLAFDHQVESNAWQLSFEARSRVFASPELFAPAYAEILRPLIEQIDRGTHLELFAAGHPAEEAMSIHGVVWANVERQWATGTCDLSDVRKRVLRFCLRGLGVAAGVIDEVINGTPSGPCYRRD